MTSPSPLLDLDRRPGAPALLRVDVAVDPAGWTAGHRDALRAAITEHGAVLVRGVDLNDRAAVGAVFRALAGDLMTEREAFAPRHRHPDGTYSSTKWPANQRWTSSFFRRSPVGHTVCRSGSSRGCCSR